MFVFAVCSTCVSRVFSPLKEKDSGHRFLVSTANNTLEVYKAAAGDRGGEEGGAHAYTLTKQSVLEMHGHR
jgi:hypothetical protein